MTLMDALIEAHLHHHTRFPLLNSNNPDDIIGYVNFKDIVNAIRINPKDPTLKGIARQALSISPEENLQNLLVKFTKGYQHIAIVQDNNKKLQGIITLEDLFEFMLGDLQDEYDLLPNHFLVLTPERFLAGGGIILKNLCESLEIDFQDKNSNENLNDFIFEKLARQPHVEDKFKWQDYLFTVRKMRRSKIHEVIIEKKS
jgi:putative hemolysin